MYFSLPFALNRLRCIGSRFLELVFYSVSFVIKHAFVCVACCFLLPKELVPFDVSNNKRRVVIKYCIKICRSKSKKKVKIDCLHHHSLFIWRIAFVNNGSFNQFYHALFIHSKENQTAVYLKS